VYPDTVRLLFECLKACHDALTEGMCGIWGCLLYQNSDPVYQSGPTFCPQHRMININHTCDLHYVEMRAI